MKTYLTMRSSVRIFLAIAAFAIFTCRMSLLSRHTLARPIAVGRNETLFRLSAVEPADDVIRKDVESLLAGDGATRRFVPLWQPPHRDDRRRLPLRYNDRLKLPDLRRELRRWWGPHPFDPTIMSRLINLVNDRQRRYSSCAVVGNSGILLNSPHGELIDAHDAVIRLNNARIAGYERHVGAKTTISFINSNILHLCVRRRHCRCSPYGGEVNTVMYICQAAHIADYMACNSSLPIGITDHRFDKLCGRIVKYYSLRRFTRMTGRSAEEWRKFHDEKMFHYSSGMQAVMLAAGICERVSVFGFGKSENAKHHYHTNQKLELDLHDYGAEYEFYEDLERRPNGIPFLRESGLEVPPIVFYR